MLSRLGRGDREFQGLTAQVKWGRMMPASTVRACSTFSKSTPCWSEEYVTPFGDGAARSFNGKMTVQALQHEQYD